MFYGRSSGDNGRGGGGGGGQRRDRYDQMTKQQELIEKKKKEIKAKLEAEKHKKEMELMLKKSGGSRSSGSSNVIGGASTSSNKSHNKYNDSDDDDDHKNDESLRVRPSSSSRHEEKKPSVPNVFANDGSFFEQFKRMQEEQKRKEEEAKKTAKVKEEIKQEEEEEVNDYGTPASDISVKASPINKPSIKIINAPIRSSSPAQEPPSIATSQNTTNSSSNSNNASGNNGNTNVMNNVPPPNFYHQVPPPPPPPPQQQQHHGGHHQQQHQQQQQQVTSSQERFYNNNRSSIPPPPPPPPAQSQQASQLQTKYTGGFPSQAVRQLAQQVAEGGEHIEEMARVENQDDPLMWFLYKPNSTEYKKYRELVSQYQNESKYQPSSFQPQQQQQDRYNKQHDSNRSSEYGNHERKRRNSSSSSSHDEDYESKRSDRHRKRRSRWGPQGDSGDDTRASSVVSPNNFEVKPNANIGFASNNSSNSSSNSSGGGSNPAASSVSRFDNSPGISSHHLDIPGLTNQAIRPPHLMNPQIQGVPPPPPGAGVSAPYNMNIPPPGLLGQPGIQANYATQFMMTTAPPPPPPPPLQVGSSPWGINNQPDQKPFIQNSPVGIGNFPLISSMPKEASLTKVTRQSRELLAYANQAYGTTNLDEEQWKQCEEAYKMNLIFQDIARKKAKDEELSSKGKFKHEYDSDEETDGGTWEHKQRMKEMEKTKEWATELTSKAKGKHHIGDFLPPEELAKFMEKYKAVKEGRELDDSDYQEFKIAESNVGFKMLQKMGWSDGQGLGSTGQGITAPVDKGNVSSDKQGLGQEKPGDLNEEDDEYTAYRKRMMLAYRFRPNPLNNPRRAYY